MRCAFCHEQLDAEAARVCPDCGTMVHRPCADDLLSCPTLGCENASFATGPPRRPARTEPGRARRAFWVLFGLLGPALAFLVDLDMRVDPLVWGWSFVGEGGWGAVLLNPRPVVVWLAVLGSLAGMLLFLRGKLRASLPLLALGVVVSAVHAIVFVPLLPLSLFGIVALGIGLLGFTPYLSLWVYVDVFRQARRRLASREKPPVGFLVDPGRWWLRLAGLALACAVAVGLHEVTPATARLLAPATRHLAGLDLAQLRLDAKQVAGDGHRHGYWNLEEGDTWADAVAFPQTLGRLAQGATHVSVDWHYVKIHYEIGGGGRGDDRSYSLYVLTGYLDEPPNNGICFRHVEVEPRIWSTRSLSNPPLVGPGPAYHPLQTWGR